MSNFGSVASQDKEVIFQSLVSDYSVLRNKKIFITGGTGFIGKWLLTSLIDANIRLSLNLKISVLSRSVSKFKAKYSELTPDFVELVEGDIRSFDFPSGDFYAVIHGATDVVAGNDELTTLDVCVEGTRRVLDFAVQSKSEKFLLISSGSVYGKQPYNVEMLSENYLSSLDPSAYSLGKYTAEWLSRQYHHNHGLKVSIARCFAFVGPYMEFDKQFAIGNFIKAVCDGKSITINGDGTAIRTYMYAADLSIWLLKLLISSDGLSVFNVGGKDVYTIKELAEKVVSVLNSDVSICVATKPDENKQRSRYVPDTGKAVNLLGLRQQVDFDEAILRTADWYKKHKL